jgi:integrase
MLKLRGQVWWTRFKHRGEVIERSTDVRSGPGSKLRASEAAALIKADHIRHSGPGGSGFADVVTLSVLEELDLQRAESSGLAQSRQYVLRYMWKNLHDHFGADRDVSQIAIRDLQGYELARRKLGRPGQTIVRERQCLVRGLRLAVESALLDVMPFDASLLRPIKRNPKLEARRGILHSEDVFALVLAHLSPKAITQGHADIIRFALFTGLRASEIQRAPTYPRTATPWGAVLHVIGAKTGLMRNVPLPRAAVEILDEWGVACRKQTLMTA